jgi:vesicle coat complex subunit
MSVASEKDQEFVELYCNYADIDFVHKAVRASGRSAIKVEKSIEKCVQALLELIKSPENIKKFAGKKSKNNQFPPLPLFNMEPVIPSLIHPNSLPCTIGKQSAGLAVPNR